MSLGNRFIPVLQIHQRQLVKTLKFAPKRYLGDPLNAVRIFNLKGVSELVITDIGATQTQRIDFDFLEKLSAQAFVPLTYGGGISSIEDVHKLYQIGFDRVLLGTAAITNPELIREIAAIYGAQSIIASMDVKKGMFGYKLTYHGGRKKLRGLSMAEMIQNFVALGVGEILLHDVDRDGTYQGLDFQLIREASALSPLPFIACGGTKSLEDAQQGCAAGASAVAAGSLFSFYGKHRAVLINYGVDG